MSKVKLEQILEALEEDAGMGFCLHCGAEQYQVEPDARYYACEECERNMVFGAEECVLVLG